ncbi:protein UXT isoform X2 [Syngnathoides biaculeatus]|uniref:protein UXT isoform X2 n=1 Tax=Syngnathoides biaculeatus TaxID=300417 RepID=UPI002ADE7B7D|nr:protein UXT isoform X2 [Syngnathoides biaculeatus]
MVSPAMSEANINSHGEADSKVLQYERFIDEVLKKDLQKVMEQRDAVYEQISHYLQLKNTLEALQETDSHDLKADVDLGCNFYVQAKVVCENFRAWWTFQNVAEEKSSRLWFLWTPHEDGHGPVAHAQEDKLEHFSFSSVVSRFCG